MNIRFFYIAPLWSQPSADNWFLKGLLTILVKVLTTWQNNSQAWDVHEEEWLKLILLLWGSVMVWSNAICRQLSAEVGISPQPDFLRAGDAYCLFIQREQMAAAAFVARYQQAEMSEQRNQWIWSVMCHRLRQLRGMFEMTSSLLKSIHFLIFEAGDHFLKVGSFTLGECMATTGTLTTPHLPFARLHPLLALPGFKHKLDHLRSSSRIVHHCIATDPVLTWLHWDIWSYSGCHLFPRRDRSQNWDPWYAHLLAALVAVHHVMWQSKLCTHYYLKFPIKDEQKEWTRGRVVIRFFHFFKYVSLIRTAMGT